MHVFVSCVIHRCLLIPHQKSPFLLKKKALVYSYFYYKHFVHEYQSGYVYDNIVFKHIVITIKCITPTYKLTIFILKVSVFFLEFLSAG